MKALIAHVRGLPSCRVQPSAGQPESFGHKLPDDLHEFYDECGGIDLFVDSSYGLRLVSPGEFLRANPVIRGCLGEDDMSYDWFIVAKNAEQYITIDLGNERCGRCYDSFWDRHALRGQSQIIAMSFTELFVSLVKSEGKYWYWLRQRGRTYGDAYDM